uniref:M20/M25/M40 family metallo-hydrolase n=1 Tax=Ramlibacter sp. TaxID=1917967 RepID=UPI0018458783
MDTATLTFPGDTTAATAAVPSCVRDGAIDPVRLLQDLIRFPTEHDCRGCVAYIADLLAHFGISSTRHVQQEERPCLVARIAGRGSAPPLLLYGHVDVVPVAGQDWSVDPFAGLVRDGFVWGRGALDMKGGIAMLVTAFVAMHRTPPPGDVILCIVSDEESGGQDGAQFLVDAHPELFHGVRHALGEFGGFSFDLFGKRFMPIQVDERRFVGITAQVVAAGGHAALGGTGNAAVVAAELVR